jgi:hypothetical protein
VSDFTELLRRAQTDYDFYLSVLADPETALSPFSLTEVERAALTGSDQEAVWRLVSRAGITGDLTKVTSEGPPSEGPPSEGPPSEGPPSEGPPSEGPPSEGPPSEGPPSEGPPSEGPPPIIGVIEGPPGGIGTPIGPGGIGVTSVVTDPVSPGIIVVIHFLTGVDSPVLSDAVEMQAVLTNRAVVSAVQDIRGASSSAERLRSVNALMKEIG